MNRPILAAVAVLILAVAVPAAAQPTAEPEQPPRLSSETLLESSPILQSREIPIGHQYLELGRGPCEQEGPCPRPPVGPEPPLPEPDDPDDPDVKDCRWEYQVCLSHARTRWQRRGCYVSYSLCTAGL